MFHGYGLNASLGGVVNSSWVSIEYALDTCLCLGKPGGERESGNEEKVLQ